MIVEPTRDKELKEYVWPGVPMGLEKHQAVNWFIANKKPKNYTVETFRYNPKTGFFSTTGY